MTYYDSIAQGYDELYKEEQIKKFLRVKETGILEGHSSILDVGCGTGFILDMLNGKTIIGVDPSQGLLNRYVGENEVIFGKAESLPFLDSTFDLVVSFTAIQNFDDVEKGLKEIKRVGTNTFAFTFLKHSQKREHILKLVEEVFGKSELFEDEKDVYVLIDARSLD